MFLQAITIDDRAYEVEKASKSFINTHIFPGGCLPSLEVIHRCIADETDLRTVWLDDITEHYGETLRHWRETFVASAKLAEELGYDLRFRRMWELYLAYVEAGFREARIGDVQMVMAKPEFRGSLGTRRAAEHAVGDPVHQEARARGSLASRSPSCRPGRAPCCRPGWRSPPWPPTPPAPASASRRCRGTCRRRPRWRRACRCSRPGVTR